MKIPKFAGAEIFDTSTTPVIYTDRSRIEAREKCPQLRFLSYHAKRQDHEQGPLGIQPFGRSIPLATGQAVHSGLAHLALWHLQTNGNRGRALGTFPDHVISDAIRSGLSEYKDLVSSRGFSSGYSPETSGTFDWIVAEQSALIEALIYVGARRVLEPLFNSGHWLLSAEQERQTYLGEIKLPSGPASLVYLSRADLEMYDPDNNSLYVVNFKTAKQYTDFQDQYLTIGLQTVGESIALEAAYRASTDQSLSHIPPNAQVAGVQYIFFLKGRQQYDKVRGHDVTYNHLIRAWTAINNRTAEQEYSWLYFYPDSKRQVLSKGSGFWAFESFPQGTKGWLNYLLAGKALPLVDPENGNAIPDPLSEVIRMPGMSYLHPRRKAQWLAQTLRDEEIFHQNNLNPDYQHSMHTNQCGWGKYKCSMFPVCHELVEIDSDMYTCRDANHPEED